MSTMTVAQYLSAFPSTLNDVSIQDTASNVATNLAQLSNSTITSIQLTDATAPMIEVTPWELNNDTALSKITGNFTIEVSPNATTSLTDSLATPINYNGDNFSVVALAGHATVVDFTRSVTDLVAEPPDFQYRASDYTITPSGSGVALSIADKYNVVDYVIGITALKFSDYTLIVAATPGPASAATTGNITELYSAVLAREPDVGGLAFYQSFLQKNPTTPLHLFAQWFLSSSEYTSAHSYAQTAAADAQFINDSYQNLLHRTPAASEVSFYQTNVLAPAVASLAPGTPAYAAAQLQAHALMLVYFSASSEFLGDVQITAQHPADAQHWLVLI